MFVCRSGFAPTPSLRDTLQESRMEKDNASEENLWPKFLSSILYEEVQKMTKKNNEDELEERSDNGCKWVKTDSEYIVLEI
ncbi:hypothetical protein TanjilG_01886 [Lupinus angustifolius]|uniref:Uncharacterized protein n=1 Tax=Lupinus angustifolius TaxID=3871 RepID=A0A394DA26_LUPAN|nr:hypothetical protein TanjilG_01886 [Lupinus angustifolius]